VIGGGALALTARFASEQAFVRGMHVLFAGGLAAALFVWIEPRCLRGPYAVMDPAVWPIWLAHVREMKPLLTLTLESPLTGIAIGTFPLAALIAVLVLARSHAMRSDFGFLAATAAFLVATATMLAAIKATSYAIWLAMPLVAVFALRLFEWLRLRTLAPRMAVGVLLTPAVLSLSTITIAEAAGLGANDSFNRPETNTCFKSASYPALAQLPPGVIAADIDYGPYILALTPHSVVAAPYHRLSSGIMAAHELFTSTPGNARRVTARLGVTYVLTCGARAPKDVPGAGLDASLWAKLKAGEAPSWLVRIPVTGPFVVYQVRS